MAYRDLREFVRKLEKEGELQRVRAEVDPILEITEITQRIARDPDRKANSVGPVLLFEKPKGSKFPLLVNTFGSIRRMELRRWVPSIRSFTYREPDMSVAIPSPTRSKALRGWVRRPCLRHIWP